MHPRDKKRRLLFISTLMVALCHNHPASSRMPPSEHRNPETMEAQRTRLKQAQQELEDLRKRFEREDSGEEPVFLKGNLSSEQVQGTGGEYPGENMEEIKKAKEELAGMKADLERQREAIERQRRGAFEEVERKRKELAQLESNQREKADTLRAIEQFKKESDAVFWEHEEKIAEWVVKASQIKKKIEAEKMKLEETKSAVRAEMEKKRRELEAAMRNLADREAALPAEAAAKVTEMELLEQEFRNQTALFRAEKEALEREKEIRASKLKELENRYQELTERENSLEQNILGWPEGEKAR